MIDFNYTILIQFFNFLVLLIILNFILFKPILKVLERRETTISSLSGGADSVTADAREMEKKYEDGSKEKRKPLIEGSQAAIAEAGAASVRMIEDARNELSRELARIRSGVERDSKEVFDALRGEVDKLSIGAAEKILKRGL